MGGQSSKINGKEDLETCEQMMGGKLNSNPCSICRNIGQPRVELPCCAEINGNSILWFCMKCIKKLYELEFRGPKCPYPNCDQRFTINETNQVEVYQGPTGNCPMCNPSGGGSWNDMCDKCAMGRELVKNFGIKHQCEGCGRVKHVPSTHFIINARDPRDYIGNWACNMGCTRNDGYTNFRVHPDCVHDVPSSLAPVSWGIHDDIYDRVRQAVNDEQNHSEEGESGMFWSQARQRADPSGFHCFMLESKGEDWLHRRLEELEVLKELHECTNGQNWIARSRWGDFSNPANLFGVSVNEEGFVTRISLFCCNLSGEIPESVGKLKDLRLLRLSFNNLQGQLPQTLAQVSNLQNIDVRGNHKLGGSASSALYSMEGLVLSFQNTRVEHSTDISLEVPKFPLFVIGRQSLLEISRLKPHEELKDELIHLDARGSEEGSIFNSWVSSTSNWLVVVKREQLAFISHRWLSNDHPDDAENSKLNHIKYLINRHPEWKYFWLDYACVPQASDAATQQADAINSLPHYVKCCQTVVTLCGNEGQSHIDIYKSRGWCRLEALSAIAPVVSKKPFADRKGTSGELPCHLTWIVSNKDTKEEEDGMENVTISSMHWMNPLEGRFYDGSDKKRISQCVGLLCNLLKDSKSTVEKAIGEYTLKTLGIQSEQA